MVEHSVSLVFYHIDDCVRKKDVLLIYGYRSVAWMVVVSNSRIGRYWQILNVNQVFKIRIQSTNDPHYGLRHSLKYEKNKSLWTRESHLKCIHKATLGSNKWQQ